MIFGGTKIFGTILVGFLALAGGGSAQSQKQHDCRKGAGGGNPPWFNPGGKCNNRQRTFIFAGTVGWPERNETHCYLYIHICSLVVKRNTIQPLGTTCPAAKDFAQPTVCCDEFNKAVQSKQPCDPMQDVDCDGVPNDQDDDPLKPGRPKDTGGAFIGIQTAAVHKDPSSGSPIVLGIPYGYRFVFKETMEVDGTMWYHAIIAGTDGGWISGSDVSCDRPPPLPLGKKLYLNDMNFPHEFTPQTMHAGANG